MARNAAITIENNFVNGLITEVTGLNMPEKACTETWNCVFETDGTITRRFGFQAEQASEVNTLDFAGKATTSYLWKNVSGDGTKTFVVVQVGDELYFYATELPSLSSGLHGDVIDLTDFLPAGAPSPETNECSFASGNGYLFVTHPTLESFYVEYDADADTLSSEQIDIFIRDFAGVDDGLVVDARPTALTPTHQYNLLNQGWSSKYWLRWNTDTILSGSGTLTNGQPTVTAITSTDLLMPGMAVTGTNVGASARILEVTGLTTLTLTANSTGSGAQTLTFKNTNYPSNADVWWIYKDSTDLFNLNTMAKISRGNTPAPKGHYILNLYDQDRETASGVSGVENFDTGSQRASVVQFYAGRVFYSGVNSRTVNSNIYFSQIIESPTQFGKCYQNADPTSETLFDLTPADGGVISIQDAGTIINMVAVAGSLLVFATNGVWSITGSEGIGFTANDYTVQKLSSISSLTSSSFVQVQGFPLWWNSDGIYSVTPSQNGSLQVQSLTDGKIKSFYQNIPASSKRFARGAHNSRTNIVQWLVRSTSTSVIDENYEYDIILNFNVDTGAFYPWTTTGEFPLRGLVSLTVETGNVILEPVLDNADAAVVDNAAAAVFVYNLLDAISQTDFKYLYDDDGLFFSEVTNEDFEDWGESYDSYFVTGYRVRGDAMKKFQPTHIDIYGAPISIFKLQGIWDYALTGNTGRWSSSQTLRMENTDYSFMRRRPKIRGHGRSLQFKVSSVENEGFHVIGWSTLDTGNQNP